MSEKLKDKILYLRIKEKDKEAFIEAYDLYLDDIYRFIFFKVSSKEEAEDLASQVFLKTWDYIQNGQLKDYKTLKALLYKVARNLVIDHYRQQSRRQNVSIDGSETLTEQFVETKDMAKEIEVAADFEALEEKMKELKDEYREIIILRFINELSISEIASVLEKNKGNVRVLVYRALNALREIVNQENK